jgi:pilus assembly protein CpaB
VGSRRTVILIAAVLIGAIAAYALYNYVNGVEDRAYDNAKRVQVFVVKQPIAKGTPGDQAVGDKLIQAGQIPQEFRPATAITDTAVLDGKVALTNLVPGQVVVDGMFVDQATAFVTFSERIPVDQVAVTVSVDQVHGVAGLLVPGDKVNLMVVLDPQLAALTGGVPGQPAAPASSDPNSGADSVRYLYQNVEVLAIGQTAAADVGATEAPANPGSGLITFNVPPDAAQRIALAGNNLYMTLAPKDFQPVDLPPVDFSTLFQPGVLTPYPAGG